MHPEAKLDLREHSVETGPSQLLVDSRVLVPDVYIETSPLLRMHTMKTPTLIMFGTRDTSVPTRRGHMGFSVAEEQ